MYSANCLDNRIKEGGTFAIDTKTGKVLWKDRKICDGLEVGSWEDLSSRVFALPDQTLLVATVGTQTGYRQLRYDMKSGGVIASDKKRLKWSSIELFGSKFISRAITKDDNSYVAARSLALSEPQWKVDGFVAGCPRTARQDDCYTTYNMSNLAVADGVLYVSAARKGLPGPAYRQLHAIDMMTGTVLWQHKDQPIWTNTKDGPKLSDDGSPMVSAGKVILRISTPTFTFFRALDAKNGSEIWATLPISSVFKEEWLPRNENRRAVTTQEVQSHLISGNVLLSLVWGGEAAHSDLWAYSMDDGKALWRRSVSIDGDDMRLAAAAGGAVYLVGTNHLSALDSQNGTLLWTYTFLVRQKDYVESPDDIWMEGGHQSQSAEHMYGEISWPTNWMIGPDGGFYIASAFNFAKLR
jgi:outer membrane protein assembly factor BamB